MRCGLTSGESRNPTGEPSHEAIPAKIFHIVAVKWGTFAMKRLRILLSILLTIAGPATSLDAQWRDVRGNLPSWVVADAIDACDSLTAVVAVRSGPPHGIYLTTKGGLTWANRSIPPTYGASDVSIIDSGHIWATSFVGHIYGSTDGGRNWTVQFYDTTVTDFMDYIEMFNLTDGVALGDSRPGQPIPVLRTTDGGTTWTQMNVTSLVGASSGDVWRRVDFVDLNTGYFFASPSQNFTMAKTTDGGATWPGTGSDLTYVQVLKFYDGQLGIAASEPQLFRTTNGGDLWQTFGGGGRGWGSDIEFVPGNPAKVWYTNGEKLFFSGDTGKTWTVQEFTLSNIVGRDIVIPNESCGWFICDNGHVYRTITPDRVTTGIESAPGLPLAYRLSQNYPNPFNPSTTIRYGLPHKSIASLIVFNTLGQQVATLVQGEEEAGYHEVRFDASSLSSGVYFYRLQAGGFVQTRKLLLIR